MILSSWLANNYSMACSIYKFIMKAEHFVTTRKHDNHDEHIKNMRAILMRDPDLTVTYRSIISILKQRSGPASSLKTPTILHHFHIENQAGCLFSRYHHYCTKQYPTVMDNIKCLNTFG